MTKSVFTSKYDQFRMLMVEARKMAGLSQQALAKRLARLQSYVSKYERGERRLDIIEFLEVSNAVGIDPVEFLRKLTGEIASGHEWPHKLQRKARRAPKT